MLNTSWYLARWTGTLELPVGLPAGTYTFWAVAHDGVRVWINNMTTPVIDHWMDQTVSPPPMVTNTVSLTPGQKVPIKIEYYEAATPGGQMQLYVQGPLGPGGATVTAIVPSTWFPSSSAALPDGWTLSQKASKLPARWQRPATGAGAA